jgi:hypothetical protein
MQGKEYHYLYMGETSDTKQKSFINKKMILSFIAGVGTAACVFMALNGFSTPQTTQMLSQQDVDYLSAWGGDAKSGGPRGQSKGGYLFNEDGEAVSAGRRKEWDLF